MATVEAAKEFVDKLDEIETGAELMPTLIQGGATIRELEVVGTPVGPLLVKLVFEWNEFTMVYALGLGWGIFGPGDEDDEG